jgi:nitroimidazol reductase NimA-like FMN-containing flavoprotein (pyridoxamine 5'-phosphate oxidase superfamily)
MDHVEYAYTTGMDEDAVVDRLREAGTGVLSLAREGDAYAIPLAHYYEDGSLYVRLGVTPDSEKAAFLAATDRATYVVYDTADSDEARELDSWSIIATGPLRRLPAERHDEFDTPAINRRFSPIRVFDEPIEAIEIEIYELAIETMAGRTT